MTGKPQETADIDKAARRVLESRYGVVPEEDARNVARAYRALRAPNAAMREVLEECVEALDISPDDLDPWEYDAIIADAKKRGKAVLAALPAGERAEKGSP